MPSAWAVNGIGPPRIDRPEVLRRSGADLAAWVVDPLLDAFEAAAIEAMEIARKRGRESVGRKPRAVDRQDEN